MEETEAESREAKVIEGVRCLECGATYAKPSAGGVVTENPGCPVCGYLGWVPAGSWSAKSSCSGDR